MCFKIHDSQISTLWVRFLFLAITKTFVCSIVWETIVDDGRPTKSFIAGIIYHEVWLKQNLLMSFLVGSVEHLSFCFAFSSFLIHTSVLQQHTVVGSTIVVEPRNSHNMMFMSATTIMMKLILITQIALKITMTTDMKRECTNVRSIEGAVARSTIIRCVTYALVKDHHVCLYLRWWT